MNKIVSPILLLGGIVLMIFGISAMNSFSAEIFRFFNGLPTNQATWMILGGAGAFVLGLVLARPNVKST
jgi:hypothetical protein